MSFVDKDNNDTDLTIISLGWGVQSFGLAVMSAVGLLPKVDFAIHSDTGHELTETYRFAERWTPWLEERGVKVITAKPSSDLLVEKGRCRLPLYMVDNGDKKPRGMMTRQCTGLWKIRPLRKAVREMFRGTLPKVEVWLGITMDEVQRMKKSNVAYMNNVYPYIDFYDYPLDRQEVIDRLRFLGVEVPPKSACYCCPYRSNAGWVDLKLNHAADFQHAVKTDEELRNCRDGMSSYLWRRKQPLSSIDPRDILSDDELDDMCDGFCML